MKNKKGVNVHCTATSRECLIDSLKEIIGSKKTDSIIRIECLGNIVCDFKTYEEIPNESIDCPECGGYIIKYTI